MLDLLKLLVMFCDSVEGIAQIANPSILIQFIVIHLFWTDRF